MKKGSSWEGLAFPDPPTGWGDRETRFPHPPAQRLRPYLPAGGGVGKPGFPTPLLQQFIFTLEILAARPSPVIKVLYGQFIARFPSPPTSSQPAAPSYRYAHR